MLECFKTSPFGLTAIVQCNDAMTVKENGRLGALLLIVLYNNEITNTKSRAILYKTVDPESDVHGVDTLT